MDVGEATGNLTVPSSVALWLPNISSPQPGVIPQLIQSMSGLILQELNRGPIYSHIYTRTFDGLGNMQIVLPDYPVTEIISVQVGQTLIPPSILPASGSQQPQGSNPGYGYRFVPWSRNLPGENAVLDFVGGFFPLGTQNIIVTYKAGYSAVTAPTAIPDTPYQIPAQQQRGIWCADNGVTYNDGTPLTAVIFPIVPAHGQYNPPLADNGGLYTFSVDDIGVEVIITSSFVPAVLTEACNQMIAERLSYRNRVGEISKSLGGQETIRYLRGGSGRAWSGGSTLPPEVMDLIWAYVNVVPPAIGAPV